jgi:hypothetical protein
MSDIEEVRNVQRKITIGKQCDVCGKKSTEHHEYDKWFNGEHHHGEWGNDSVDSYEYFDVCSVPCFKAQLKDSLDEMEGYATAEIFDMSYEFAKELYESMI